MRTKLEIKIIARNRCNAIANMLVPLVFTACAPFVGQKVKTAAGDRTVKFHQAIEALDICHRAQSSDESTRVNVWLSNQFSVLLNVEVQVTDGDHTQTADVVVFVGLLEGAVLQSINPIPGAFKTDFHSETIIAARDWVIKTRAELRDAEHFLCGFGEHDSF